MNKRIMIVDDSSTMRQILRRLLEKNGFVIAGLAENGVEAVKRYSEVKPDLVTLDMIMPRQNGLETLKQIKQLDPGAVVVMVSSLSAKDPIMECAKAGANHYILKPFNEDKVMTVLQEVLGPMPEAASDSPAEIPDSSADDIVAQTTTHEAASQQPAHDIATQPRDDEESDDDW